MPELDNYTIREYGWMINSRSRTTPFVEALKRAVKSDSVVIDIGSGTGIFAFVACQLGARRVYAIEADDSIEVAKLCAESNPGAERITWIQGLSTEVELPERGDIVIADLHGNLPFHAANLPSMIDARRRLLKPDGLMIPNRDILQAAPAQAQEEYEAVLSPWRSNEYGVDFSAGQCFVQNAIWRAKPAAVSASDLLAPPVTWGTIDYSVVESPNFDGNAEWVIRRHGTMHGFYVWFDGDVGKGLGFSNAPDLEPLPYGRAFFPLQEAVPVEPGGQLTLRIAARLVNDGYVFRWDTRVTDVAGATKAEFAQSTFKDRPLKLARLKQAAENFVPKLNAEGEIDLAILNAISDSQELGEIAKEMALRYPVRFPSIRAALAYVGRVSSRYS